MAYTGEDFFTYELDFANVSAGAAVPPASIVIQADSDFELQKLAQASDIAGAAQTESSRVLPLATVLIQVGNSGRNLSSGAVPIPNMFGSGEIPFVLPRPRLFKAQTTITVTLACYAAAGTTYSNIRLSFIGRKLYLK